MHAGGLQFGYSAGRVCHNETYEGGFMSCLYFPAWERSSFGSRWRLGVEMEGLNMEGAILLVAVQLGGFGFDGCLTGI